MRSIHSLLQLVGIVAFATTTPVVFGWLPHPLTSTIIASREHRCSLERTCLQQSTAAAAEAAGQSELPPPEDYTGKTIYQRSFYRLSPGSSNLSHPNAIVLEERLRFQPDPNQKGYILPKGPRTFIIRKGTHEDAITDELYRVDLGSIHNGPGTMDTSIATMLYLASNPELVQGEVLELACEDGAASLVGCMAAKLVLDPPLAATTMPVEGGDLDIMTVPEHKSVFPKRMHHLTLSEEEEDGLKSAYDSVKGFSNGEVSLKNIQWSTRLPDGGRRRRYDHYYRLIVGSDIDLTYPSTKELARVVANYLLPSDEFAVVSIKGAGESAAVSSSSFGGLGMDIVAERSSSSARSGGRSRDPDCEVDPKYPSTFVHVCPDTRENTTYLRQFLEKGFRMTVETGYLKMERLRFVFQTLDEDDPESMIEDLDLEVKDETYRSYQSLTAVHHPEYAGEGTGEYFFPMETGEYEGGSRSLYLEPEEEGSPW